MRNITFVAAFYLCALTLSSPAFAADITPIQNEVCDLVLDGPIEPGDAGKVGAEAAMFAPERVTICLNSPGGNYLEGRNLFSLFMDMGISTYVPKGAECYSACALAFLGGSIWGDFRHPSRIMEPGAIVGFHAPYLDPPIGSYTAEDVAISVSNMVTVIGDLMSSRRSLMISEKFMGDFLLFNSREAKALETVGDAANAGVSLRADGLFPDKFEARAAACEVMFDVYGADFENSTTALSPNFSTEKSEFFELKDFGIIEFEGDEWKAVGVDYVETDWPALSSGCAFKTLGSEYTGEVMMWISPWGSHLSGPETAEQIIMRYSAWWYSKGASYPLALIPLH